MTINQIIVKRMLLHAADLLENNAVYLGQIDSRFGDGDHGITMVKISKLIKKKIPDWHDESMADFFDSLGMAIMEVRGGSAGPLYGTMIGGMGSLLSDEETELDADGAKRMLQGSFNAMQDITSAKIGDKTMMDALIPAVEAAQKTDGGIREVWQEAAMAAEAGARSSEQYIAKFGRAKMYKEETLGTPDAGAVSTSLLIRGMADGI